MQVLELQEDEDEDEGFDLCCNTDILWSYVELKLSL